MFSSTPFVRKTIKFVLGIVFTGLIFLPKTLEAAVQAAGSQKDGRVLTHVRKHVSDIPTVSGDVTMEQVFDDPSGDAFSVLDLPGRLLDEWKSWEVIPSLSPNALSIYQKGLLMGNNPRAFSKVGDGEISAAWFLTDFDLGNDYFNLGENTSLQMTINYFVGSFARQSQSARRGFNAQRILDPTLADKKFCQPNETPLDCEMRLHRPSFALISMGTNQVWQAEQFESGLRTIIEKLIARGVVPVLSTKADDLEGDGRINLIIARLAVEYDLPLWNFWNAVQPLPNQGLQDDREHLTYYPNNFDDQEALQFAWPVRNLSALRVLERLMNDAQR